MIPCRGQEAPKQRTASNLPNAANRRQASAFPVRSIPIAHSTFRWRRLAQVVLGRDRAWFPQTRLLFMPHYWPAHAGPGLIIFAVSVFNAAALDLQSRR